VNVCVVIIAHNLGLLFKIAKTHILATRWWWSARFRHAATIFTFSI